MDEPLALVDTHPAPPLTPTPEEIRDAFVDPPQVRLVASDGRVLRLVDPRLAEVPCGLHDGLPAHVYHERVAGIVSKGALDRVLESPAHYKYWVSCDESDEDTDAYAIGRAMHCAVLEPDVFLRTYAAEPDFGYLMKHDASGTTAEEGKANKLRRKAWLEEHDGFEIVPFKTMQMIVGMSESIRRHPFAQKLITGGKSEHTAVWTDPATGLRCKARADYYLADRRTIVDIKTTQDASPRAFARDVYKYGYHRQHAHYTDGFGECGAPVDNFVFIVVEKAAPHVVSVFMLDEAAVQAGRADNRLAMERLAACLETDTWPGYSDDIEVIKLPPWAL
jgi:hypothetical protein